MRFGGTGFSRLFGFSPRLTAVRAVPTLGASTALTAVGAGVTVVADGAGAFLVTSDGTGSGGTGIRSTVALPGNIALEVETIVHINDAWFGFSTTDPGSNPGVLGDCDEVMAMDEGFGVNAIDFYKTGAPIGFNLQRIGRSYLTRLDGMASVRSGPSWAYAPPALGATSRTAAVNASDRFLRAHVGKNGQWRVRFVGV